MRHSGMKNKMKRWSAPVPRVISLSSTLRCPAPPTYSFGSESPPTPASTFFSPIVRLVSLSALIGLGSCSSALWRTPSSDEGSISVGRAEVFENADLQARLDQLRSQLAALNATDQTSLTAAMTNNQGVSNSQSGFSLKVLSPGTATAPDSGAAAATTPTASSAAQAPRTVLETQYQLSSQITGYSLLLSGSDFARYTTNGAAKDHIVVGFPISINAGLAHRDQAAEVRIVYYPPNAAQFEDPKRFANVGPSDHQTQSVCSEKFFSPGDPNAPIACLEQEQSPTIITLLPNDTGYNTANISSKSVNLGLGAVIGTVNVGASAGRGQQTQYIRAAQDTVGMEESGPHVCRSDAPRSELGVQCIPNSRGVAFRWQFRPVLGERTVRTLQRLLFVQLAIPYAHRPYPGYGGVVEVQTRWLPFDSALGVIKGPHSQEETAVSTVFGHPFMSPVIFSINVKDLGAGSVLVIVQGKYLIGATVRIGSTVLNGSSPGFLTTYNALQFTTTAQALALSGAFLTSSSGVDTPLTAVSLCKAQDPLGECYRNPADSRSARFKIKKISIDPISDSASQVRIELTSAMSSPDYDYKYHRYFRSQGDVVETTDDRKPADKDESLDKDVLKRINMLPILVYAGGKAYGFSDLPLQYLNPGDPSDLSKSSPSAKASPFAPRSAKSSTQGVSATAPHDLAVISFIAANDSLNASPELKVQRLFGDPESDSAFVPFVPLNSLTVAAIPKPTPPKKADDPPAPRRENAPVSANSTSVSATPQPTSTTQTPTPAGGGTTAAPPVAAPKVPSEPAPNKPAPPAPKPGPVAEPKCDQETQSCEYLLSGAWADAARPDEPCGPPHRNFGAGMISFVAQSSGHSVRRFTALKGTKQVSLNFELRSSADSEDCIIQTLTLPLASLPSTSSTDPLTALNFQTQTHPNFSLVRSVMTTHEAEDGTASITVGVQKLKDQTAILTVAKANIDSATDGNKVSLAVLPGGQVTVSQDTLITFKLRDADPANVNITAEGKNGSVSTGKVSFKNPFAIVPRPSPASAGKH